MTPSPTTVVLLIWYTTPPIVTVVALASVVTVKLWLAVAIE